MIEALKNFLKRFWPRLRLRTILFATLLFVAALPGFAITDRTIDSHIRNLRAKLAAAGGHDAIETRAGIGYRIGPCTGSAA